LLFSVLLGTTLPSAARAKEKASAGVIIETVNKGSVAEKAGLLPGDVIITWSRAASPPANPQPAQGHILSPFDLLNVEWEQSPRGPITLAGTRTKRKLKWQLSQGSWGLAARPALQGNLLTLYQKGKDSLEAKQPKDAVAHWRDAAEEAKKEGKESVSTWLYFKMGEALAGTRNWAETDAAYNEAVEESNKNGPESTSSYILRQWGQTFLRRNAWDRMEEIYRRAMAEDQRVALESLAIAHSLANLGIAAASRGQEEEAGKLFRQSLAMREKLAPGSLDVARSLSNLGTFSMSQRDLAAAEDYLQRARKIFEQLSPDSRELVTVLNNLGALAADAQRLDVAEDYFQRGLALQERLNPGSYEVAQSLNNLGVLAGMRGNREAQEKYYQRSLEIGEKVAPESRVVAVALQNLAELAAQKGDLPTAANYIRRAVSIQERVGPGTRELADMLGLAGMIALKQGNLDAAEEHLKRALAIQEKVSPESHEAAEELNELGIVTWTRGDLAAAENYHLRALKIRQKLAPDGSEVASSLNNLGLVAWNRGDLAAAEEYFQRALVIGEKLEPQGGLVSTALTNLGNVAADRQDPETARNYELRALAINEKLAPESIEVARSLSNLGRESLNLGDQAAAQDYQLRALTLREKLAPGSLDVASALASLGELALRRGDPKAAREYYERSLAIKEQLAPGSLVLAETLNELGSMSLQLGDLQGAEQNYNKALEIRTKLAPGSTAEADSLHGLGATYRAGGNGPLAQDFFCRAVQSLEQQKTKLGGTQETKTRFGSEYAEYYRDCVGALIEEKHPEEAFAMLERSRARSLLELLAERDLLFAADIPAELARQRRLADKEYDSTQTKIQHLNPVKDAEEIERLLARLREIHNQQEEIATRIRAASPRLASLQYPQPLDLAGVRAALDPGTVLLAYTVGASQSFLFVVKPATDGSSGLSVFPLGAAEKSLREKVGAFRNVIVRNRAADQAALSQEGSQLYDLLVRPAESLIAGSQRLLISPDGPLHTLPFAALVRNEVRKKREIPQYLAEWKPLHTVVSATVYAELQKARGAGGAAAEASLVAFGDPKYPAIPKEGPLQVENGELRSVVKRGFLLMPLPSTRVEVESIFGLFGETGNHVYLGADATEERAKAIGKKVRYIHFAVHGLLDEQFPLNSALVLTIPEHLAEGQDNGLLQAWEIFEQVRIDADLVTLSACETALGKEMGGEGLVGLTRAFEYAGAHSVLASLWSVSDESTAELMKRFYGYLKAGKTKDEALRLAQVDLIHAGDQQKHAKEVKVTSYAHPFHWAAFNLIGDWK
jgi:CHAT domain-containing protein/Tfp pilus assembly protein PilF